MFNKKENAVVKKFTLIELLLVIGIIAVLAGLLTPAVLTARTRARILEAKTNANGIKIAIELFKTDNNGLLPLVNSGKDTIICSGAMSEDESSPKNKIGFIDASSAGLEAILNGTSKKIAFKSGTGTIIDDKEKYADLYRKLCGVDIVGGTTSELNSPKNKRKKVYLLPKNGVMIEKSGGGAVDDGEIIKSFITSWGAPYVIILDTNYDNKIELKIDGKDVVLNGSVFVLAPGPNGIAKASNGTMEYAFKINGSVDNYYLDKDTIKSFK